MAPEMTKHDHVLAGLVFSLQAAAMQQLGKIQNPMTGEVEMDLEQAKGTIDLLEMLKVKCRTDTPEDLLKVIDSADMDHQLNYMDEGKKKGGDQPEDEPGGDEDAGAKASPEDAQDDAEREGDA